MYIVNKIRTVSGKFPQEIRLVFDGEEKFVRHLHM